MRIVSSTEEFRKYIDSLEGKLDISDEEFRSGFKRVVSFDEPLVFEVSTITRGIDLGTEFPWLWEAQTEEAVSISRNTVSSTRTSDEGNRQYIKKRFNDFIHSLPAPHSGEVGKFVRILKNIDIPPLVGLKKRDLVLLLASILASIEEGRYLYDTTGKAEYLSNILFASLTRTNNVTDSKEVYDLVHDSSEPIKFALFGSVEYLKETLSNRKYSGILIKQGDTQYPTSRDIIRTVFEAISKLYCELYRTSKSCSVNYASSVGKATKNTLSEYFSIITTHLPKNIGVYTLDSVKFPTISNASLSQNYHMFISKGLAETNTFYVVQNDSYTSSTVRLPRRGLQKISFYFCANGIRASVNRAENGSITVKYSLLSKENIGGSWIPSPGQLRTWFVLDYGDEIIKLPSAREVGNFTIVKKYTPVI